MNFACTRHDSMKSRTSSVDAPGFARQKPTVPYDPYLSLTRSTNFPSVGSAMIRSSSSREYLRPEKLS